MVTCDKIQIWRRCQFPCHPGAGKMCWNLRRKINRLQKVIFHSQSPTAKTPSIHSIYIFTYRHLQDYCRRYTSANILFTFGFPQGTLNAASYSQWRTPWKEGFVAPLEWGLRRLDPRHNTSLCPGDSLAIRSLAYCRAVPLGQLLLEVVARMWNPSQKNVTISSR